MAPAAVFDWIGRRTELRRRAGLTRHVRPRPAEEPVLDLAGNDYLGLVRHPRVVRAATEAVAGWGGGATGSRLVTGTTLLHQELEEELAAFCGFEAALEHIANRDNMDTATNPASRWLFPGRAGQPFRP
ncbi:aminotransferase class I/II-fold pyridoxal phosphate-dependent enzyme, partial [Streptomyces sp. NPDC127074]|uniref:aminotransferase class I/II-fold pyridoxal phosphate-dependent enzyme n=1 Tax=Streptomyces sp. NPDC127074 TaxID=3347130 RepID=UPI003647A721